MDAVIGGGGSKALGLGFSSKIDTTTTSSLRAMVVTTKRSKLAEHRLWQFYLGLFLGGAFVRIYCTPSPLRYALTNKDRLEVELLCSVV
jgi:hypothetical protein